MGHPQKMFPVEVTLPLCPKCSAHAVDMRFGFGACLKCRHDLTVEEGFQILVRKIEALEQTLELVRSMAQRGVEAYIQTAPIGRDPAAPHEWDTTDAPPPTTN